MSVSDKPTEEQVADNSKETVTRVTTIAQEEARTGKKIDLPTPEELVAKASMSIISNRKHLANLLPKLGKKAKDRVLLAVLDLPTNDKPVKLVSDEEKVAFRLGQSVVRAMYTVMFYHTQEEIRKHRENQKNQENKEDAVCNTENQSSLESAGSNKQETVENISPQSQEALQKTKG